MSDQGRGYGPFSDLVGTLFWILAWSSFVGVGGLIIVIGAFFAGWFVGS